MDFLISAADLVFTGDTLLEHASILVEGGLVMALNPPTPSPAPHTVDGLGQLVLPAPIDAADPEAYAGGAVPLEPTRLRKIDCPAGHLVAVDISTEECRFRYGRRPIEVLADFGWLTSGVAVSGLTDLSDEEIRRIAASGVALVHFPTRERLTGRQPPALRRWLDAGVTVGLGGDPLLEARQALLLQRGRGQEVAAAELIALATQGGAKATGQDGGVIRPGAPARLLLSPALGDLESFLLTVPTLSWQILNPCLQHVPQPA